MHELPPRDDEALAQSCACNPKLRVEVELSLMHAAQNCEGTDHAVRCMQHHVDQMAIRLDHSP
eukprot:5266040-Pleurochrysis_carterae.AAC.1